MTISVIEQDATQFVRGANYDFGQSMTCRCEDGSDAEFQSGRFVSSAREGGATLIFEGRPVGGGVMRQFGVPTGTRAIRQDR